MAKSILVVEDDQGVRTYLKEFFLENGFTVQAASDGTTGILKAEKVQPDIVILDLGLPNMGGEVVCRELKEKYPDLPIIILTAKEGSANVVAGFNLGADDYMTKPFEGSELIARVRARLKMNQEEEKILQVADLTLNPKTFLVKRGKKETSLTPQEFKLLQYLMANSGRVLTREMILGRVWGYSPDIESRVVDTYIGYLRKKIDHGFSKKLIVSLRGFGYMVKA